MITVAKIHVSPVKSLALSHPAAVDVGWQGIDGDRRLFLVDERGRLLTQRQVGRLARVEAEYRPEPEWLALHLPGAGVVEGPVNVGEPTVTRIFGRRVMGNAVIGEWDSALSEFCGLAVRLTRAQQPGQCYDEFPISLLSAASLERLSEQPGAGRAPDSRRFRPNFLLEGCGPHQEDDWIGEAVQIGDGLQVRVVARDPRCAITAHDPDTGETDFDAPQIIASYRPAGGAAYFGVYGIVERPGRVSVGDAVRPPVNAPA